MKRAIVFVALGAAMLLGAALPAGAAPINSHGQNAQPPFQVDCDGTQFTLVGAPSSDHTSFTPAFVTTTHQLGIPISQDSQQSTVLLSATAVFDGVTYHAGDTIFSNTETVAHGVARPSDSTCTFGGSQTGSFPDDNGQVVDVQFNFSGTAVVKLPNTK